ncbi:MAG TPA: hypothetical protein VGO73_04620 [Pyrinomonadaceae bacterium]|jgi:hypothetical protein|nr:hypothetical protein [Pyrinomonadaceae bacterium]
MLKIIISLFTVALISSGCSKNSATVASNKTAAQAPLSSSRPVQHAAGELRFKAPEAWTAEKPTSDMRVAQYKLPKTEGDHEDALLVIYYFGQGQGGSPEANIDRWINQIKQPDGQSSKERAKTGTLTVNGLQVSTVDVSGNYSGGMSPDSAPADNKSIYRLRAAVVDTPKGSYFVKLTGPENTVAHWDQAYTDYMKSFEFK